MNAKRFSALLLVACVLAADTFLPVLAHHRNNHGIELLLAAGILAKLLHKKGHHHHGHHHHGHHHHGHHHSGSSNVEVMHHAPSSYAPQHAATSYSSSIEYPAASHAYPVAPPMPYAPGYMGFEPQPMAYGPPHA